MTCLCYGYLVFSKVDLSVCCYRASIMLCMLFFPVHGQQDLNFVLGDVQKLQKLLL